MMRNHLFEAVIFDLDGVITRTALIHAQAWKETFDEYLRLRERRDKEPFKEFTYQEDYLKFVDGKPRYEGVKSFLASRGIKLPFGDPADAPEEETICGIGNKKNMLFSKILREKGVEVYPSSVEFVHSLKKAGIKVGVASSSKNCVQILEVAGLKDLFETIVDGKVSARLGLQGKPEGDIFVTAAYNLGVSPAKAVVVEDAISGVEAGRNGGFGLVIGVARERNQAELLDNGADIAVSDLSRINLEWIDAWFLRIPSSLFTFWEKRRTMSDIIKEEKTDIFINPYYFRSSKELFFSGKKLAFFLDYDGTLTPIVDRPEYAVVSSEMRKILKQLSSKYPTAIVSGRLKKNVENLVGIKGLFYAGSHGFEISGPNTLMIHPQAKEFVPLILEVTNKLKEELSNIEGVIIEEKKLSVAVHYRLVNQEYWDRIKDVVKKSICNLPSLRLMKGKKVFEIMPATDWNKAKAVRWIMQVLGLDWDTTSVIYLGDDTTDEDVFRFIRTRGLGILVSENPRPSAAEFRLASPDEVGKLFKKILGYG